jgi:predicted PhzF superfamily epimerase YddE/YHI9
MNLKIYQVDAFAEKVFEGNPAAVVPLQAWIADSDLQQIAAENNLSETAFYVENKGVYEIRWFTPTVEVDLCGHATLASAHVLFSHEGFQENEIQFHSHRSGPLAVKRSATGLQLDFPVDQLVQVALTDELTAGVMPKPQEIWKGKSDYVFVYEKESDISDLEYDLNQIAKIDARGIIVTAPGREKDFVSRFFGPQSGVPEDPVTGSAHTTLMPFWTKVLGKQTLTARQISQRGGNLTCTLSGERVLISGKAITYLVGEIQF